MKTIKFDNREVEIKKYEDLDMIVVTVHSLHNSDQRLSFTLRGKEKILEFVEELTTANINSVLNLAAKLPSGLNDPKAAEKLLVERQELIDALADGDHIGALTEGADAVYYAAKHLDWVARQLGLEIDELFRLAVAKYSLRAQPGNPKNDQAERRAIVQSITYKD